MIKPFTCVCMLMAAGSGLFLYSTKHRSQMLDREIGRTLKQIDAARDRTGVLKGEWALLNEPERLAELSQQHLSLRTLAPTQFTSLADLGNRLPAPLPQARAMPPADEPATPTPEVPMAATVKPASTRLASVQQPGRSVSVAAAAPAQPVATPVPMQMAALPVPPAAAPGRTRVNAPAVVPTAAQAPIFAPVSAPVSAPVFPPASPPVLAPVAHAQAPAIASLHTPLPPAPAPRFMAPIVAVSAAPMVVPPAPPGPARVLSLATRTATASSIGDSVARTQRRTESAPQIQSAAYAPAPVIVQGTVQATSLGGYRAALPAPVPYGAVSR